MFLRLGVGAHAFNASTWELETGLGYIVSSRPARDMQLNLSLKKKINVHQEDNRKVLFSNCELGVQVLTVDMCHAA